LDFGGNGRGREGPWGGKLLFGSLKKNKERFSRVFEGLFCPILIVPPNWGILGVKHTN